MVTVPIRDEVHAHPIAVAWRATIGAIVRAFASGDFELSSGVPGVSPPPATVSAQMRGYVADYGEALAELPDEAWNSSVCQWMVTHWDVVVDLWTVGGRSDLVLSLRVLEENEGFRFEVDSLHVP